MSLVVKFGDGENTSYIAGAIYFDAVTNYSRTMNGQVTEHPIESGASITDHFISKNPKFSISGVISHIDVSGLSSMISFEDSTPVKNSKSMLPPTVISNLGANLIPGAISQFLPKTTPTIIVARELRQNPKKEIESFLTDLMKGVVYNKERNRWQNKMTLCTLFEIEGVSPVRIEGDLVCVSVSINEREDTGDALFLDIEFEKVDFSVLSKVDAPKPAKKTATARATEEKKDKGTVVGSTAEEPQSLSVMEAFGNAVR